MTEQIREQELRQKLEGFGDARKTSEWHKGDPDYVTALGVTASDVPRLLAEVRQWVEREDWPDDENDMTGFAPIHAWRALAQLGAVEAIALLLEMIEPLDADDDDWYLDEFPHVFAWIGPASIEPLQAYMEDEGRREFAQICMSRALARVAVRHEDCRDKVVAILTDRLTGFEHQPETLNAFLISDLMELKATESAGTIERAFAADRVDLSIMGNWNMVRKEMDVEGEGLVPKELANAKWSWVDGSTIKQPAVETMSRKKKERIRKQRDEKQRAERKAARRNRKRGRKR